MTAFTEIVTDRAFEPIREAMARAGGLSQRQIELHGLRQEAEQILINALRLADPTNASQLIDVAPPVPNPSEVARGAGKITKEDEIRANGMPQPLGHFYLYMQAFKNTLAVRAMDAMEDVLNGRMERVADLKRNRMLFDNLDGAIKRTSALFEDPINRNLIETIEGLPTRRRSAEEEGFIMLDPNTPTPMDLFRRLRLALASELDTDIAEITNPITTEMQPEQTIITKPSIGSIFRSYRGTMGLTQKGLAGITGLSQSTIGEIESGLARVSPETAQRIANALGIPKKIIDDLHDQFGHTRKGGRRTSTTP